MGAPDTGDRNFWFKDVGDNWSAELEFRERVFVIDKNRLMLREGRGHINRCCCTRTCRPSLDPDCCCDVKNPLREAEPVAVCICLGAAPPVDFLAVCLVLAI